ncbi:MAG: hypothetical protein ACR2GI_04595 [Thermomicrobiales bacterium]
MSDRDSPPTRLNNPGQPTPTHVAEPTLPETVGTPPGAAVEDTAGTGTAIALGCIGATLFLILVGLIFIGITQLFG